MRHGVQKLFGLLSGVGGGDANVSILSQFGLAGALEFFAAVLTDSDRAIVNGHLLLETSDLLRLIGRPTTPLAPRPRPIPI